MNIERINTSSGHSSNYGRRGLVIKIEKTNAQSGRGEEHLAISELRVIALAFDWYHRFPDYFF